MTPQMQGLDVPQKNITVLQPSNFSVRLVTQCLAEKRLAVVRLVDGEEIGVSERKRVGGVGFGEKKVGRELSLEQEKLTQISDLEDEIRCWVKSKSPHRWARLPWLVRVNDPSVFGRGVSRRRTLPGWQQPGAAPADLSEQHQSLNDFFLKVAGETQTGCQIVISSQRGDHY